MGYCPSRYALIKIGITLPVGCLRRHLELVDVPDRSVSVCGPAGQVAAMFTVTTVCRAASPLAGRSMLWLSRSADRYINDAFSLRRYVVSGNY
jgi:hypothetical protein